MDRARYVVLCLVSCVYQLQIPIFFDESMEDQLKLKVRQLEFLYGNGWLMGLVGEVNMEKITIHQKVKFCIELFQRYWGYRKK
jgi:hypothetical protein